MGWVVCLVYWVLCWPLLLLELSLLCCFGLFAFVLGCGLGLLTLVCFGGRAWVVCFAEWLIYL